MAEKHTHRGVVFFVGLRDPFPGVGWVIVSYDHLQRPSGGIESPGAFYDGEPCHPEGGKDWARTACMKYIDRMLDES